MLKAICQLCRRSVLVRFRRFERSDWYRCSTLDFDSLMSFCTSKDKRLLDISFLLHYCGRVESLRHLLAEDEFSSFQPSRNSLARISSLRMRRVVARADQLSHVSAFGNASLLSIQFCLHSRFILSHLGAAYKCSCQSPFFSNSAVGFLLVFSVPFSTSYYNIICARFSPFSSTIFFLVSCVFKVLLFCVSSTEFNFIAVCTITSFFFPFLSLSTWAILLPNFCNEFWRARKHLWLQRCWSTSSLRRSAQSLLHGAFYVNLSSYWWWSNDFLPFPVGFVLRFFSFRCFESGRFALWRFSSRTNDCGCLRCPLSFFFCSLDAFCTFIMQVKSPQFLMLGSGVKIPLSESGKNVTECSAVMALSRWRLIRSSKICPLLGVLRTLSTLNVS